MKSECWTAVRGACLWERFQQNLAQTCPVVRSQLGKGRGPGCPVG